MREMPVGAQRAPHTRTDPDYAPDVEVFDNLTHSRIHDGVQQLDPAALAAGQQVWQGSAHGLADAVAQAHTDIRGLIADGWRGGAADSAAEAVRAFERDGQQLADVMSTVAQRLGQASDAAESLRAAVGEPPSQQPDLDAALLDPGQATANSAAQKFAENARQDAVAAMDGIYTGAFIRSGAGVPAFTDITQGGETSPAAVSLSSAAVGALPDSPADSEPAAVPRISSVSTPTVTAVAAPAETSAQQAPQAASAAPAAAAPATVSTVAAPAAVDSVTAAQAPTTAAAA
ncbi:WXG100 family type VII secretion target, partial [Nocardia arizonensis]